MSPIATKTGFLNTDGIRHLSWDSPTTANITWEDGSTLLAEFKQSDADFLRHRIEMDIKYAQDAYDKMAKYGWHWKERVRAEGQEDMEDYRKQRRELRDAGIYMSKIESGKFSYRIENDEGKTWTEGSFHFGPGHDEHPWG